eukprot:TRINITY_DN60312_c0_g1_i1.p1 TRINITY_DN60312_c0_g1~~TRINITY_DN60312_c0_g1_i1.p1  ORF type:complete len:322 (+),score=45.08 TRINITY_DN60312_c0_g1_i1:70-1035(+)
MSGASMWCFHSKTVRQTCFLKGFASRRSGVFRQSPNLLQVSQQRAPNLRDIRRIIAVSSCKGGVGKSTVAVNLAFGLAAIGNSVGILDADLFGPSIPRMVGREDGDVIVDVAPGRPKVLHPVHVGGVATMSMGYLIEKTNSVAWRGPLVVNGISELIVNTQWGALDYLIVDMPPGTADVHLSVVQIMQLDGALVVSTPQEIALIDVVRGIDLFERVRVPVLGVVANMAGFICSGCDARHELFGNLDALEREAAKRSQPLVGRIPLIPALASDADGGRPAALYNPESVAGRLYRDLATNVVRRVEAVHASLPPPPVVEMDNS